MYVQKIAKELPETKVRQAFANFGKISSFKFLAKPKFSHNTAFVMYSEPKNAQAAIIGA